jgi:hypothetical protein
MTPDMAALVHRTHAQPKFIAVAVERLLDEVKTSGSFRSANTIMHRVNRISREFNLEADALSKRSALEIFRLLT